MRRNPSRLASTSLVAVALVLLGTACGSSSPKAASSADANTNPPTTQAPTTTTSPATTTTPGSTKLVAETGVTPVQLQRAEKLLSTTITDLQLFRTPEMAYAAGYRSIGDKLTGDEHYVNWSYSNDGHVLDPTRPESVVYEERNGQQVAVAAMYSLPFGSTFRDVPDVGGSLTQWHVHRDLCLTDNPEQRVVAGLTSLDGGCPKGTTKAGNTPMLHVWNIPNPCGPFAALEGIGAGQVPAGQTRNCDTRNALVP